MISISVSRPVSHPGCLTRLRTRLAISLFGACILAQIVSGQAIAAEKFELSPQAYKRIVAAREYIADQNYSKAEEVLLRQKESSKGRKFDLVEVLRTLGFLYATQEKHKQATAVFEEAVSIADIPLSIRRELRYNLAQMYMVGERFENAAAQLEIYLTETAEMGEKATPVVYMALASSYSQAGKFQKVVKPARAAIAASKEPKESWYQLLLSAHYQIKQFREAAEVLKLLVNRYPEKKQYWTQLSSMYMQLKQDAEALAVFEVMYKRGMYDTPREYMQLVNFLSYQNNALRAGQVLKSAIEDKKVEASVENFLKLANFWRQARDTSQAIDAYQSALTLQRSAKTQIELAYQLLESERYQEMIDTLESMASDATSAQKGRAYLLVGQAWYSLEKPDRALAAMREAARFPESEKEALRWISFLTST